jgi:uncharacterized membrane protein YkvI
VNLSSFWSGLKVAWLIVGTTVGAGYASGRELWEFFGSYGPESQRALALAIVLFSVSCYVIMEIGRRLNALHYRLVLEEIIGKRLAGIYDLLIFLYLLSTTVVMLAGSGAALKYWDFPYWAGVVLTAALVFVVFLRETKGILLLNSILMPLMLAFLGVACLFFLAGQSGPPLPLKQMLPQAISSAVAFTALNILPLVAVLSVMGAKLDKGAAVVSSVSSGICLAFLSLLYNQSLLHVEAELHQVEVPLYALFQNFRIEWLFGGSVVLWLAIYTTAVSNLFGLIARIKAWIPASSWLIALVVVIVLIPLTGFGFGRLIQVLYPLYGVLNLFLLTMILLYPLSHERHH